MRKKRLIKFQDIYIITGTYKKNIKTPPYKNQKSGKKILIVLLKLDANFYVLTYFFRMFCQKIKINEGKVETVMRFSNIFISWKLIFSTKHPQKRLKTWRLFIFASTKCLDNCALFIAGLAHFKKQTKKQIHMCKRVWKRTIYSLLLPKLIFMQHRQFPWPENDVIMYVILVRKVYVQFPVKKCLLLVFGGK